MEKLQCNKEIIENYEIFLSRWENHQIHSMDYPFSLQVPKKNIHDQKAVILRSGIYSKIKYRIYSAKELTDHKTDEAQNIYYHLSQTLRCPELISGGPLTKPIHFDEWVSRLASEHEFSEVLYKPGEMKEPAEDSSSSEPTKETVLPWRYFKH